MTNEQHHMDKKSASALLVFVFVGIVIGIALNTDLFDFSSYGNSIPRSMGGDSGSYSLVSKDKVGTSMVVVSKRVGPTDTLYTKTEIDCGTKMYKVLGEGNAPNSISGSPGHWVRAIAGSSKSDLLNFVCK